MSLLHQGKRKSFSPGILSCRWFIYPPGCLIYRQSLDRLSERFSSKERCVEMASNTVGRGMMSQPRDILPQEIPVALQ
jgi:hypothetical protein